MNRRSLSLFALLSVLICTTALAQSSATQIFFADMRGANEVPAVTSNVVGAALFTLDSNNLLTFEINAPGIVSPTAAHIHGPDATPTTTKGVFAGFAPPATFSNGRLKGTVQLPQSDADKLRVNPSGFYANVHTTAHGGGEIRGTLVAAIEQDVAVAGNVTTGAGDKFVTDARVFNPSSTSRATALVEFFGAGSAPNVNATASTTLDLAPRAEAVLDDVTGPNGLNVAGQVGALRVTSGSNVVVTSNIYNDQRGATPSRGTFGQFVPAVARANALKRGVILHLANKNRDAANPSGFRTNVGFFNPNQESVTIALTLRDASGASLGTANVVLPALQQQQSAITALFPSVDLSNSAPLTLAIDATLPVLAYGAVNDNISGDSIFVPAQPDSGATP
ncbi:MAG TPA: CHRD domain-containing protein [Thermoanaerobaculia bacterium]|nr:CHRD domain-containing protein [Thermoanaerobaculia bacterium]